MIQKAIRVIGALPSGIRRTLAGVLAIGVCVIPNQTARMTRTNLRLAFPHLGWLRRQLLACHSIYELAQKSFDIAATWVRPPGELARWVQSSEGLDVFLALPADQPKLVLLPHLGNWELFGMWLSAYQPYTAMFRPLREQSLTDLVRDARMRGGNHLVPTDAGGLRQLMSALRSGGAVIVLPDQSPHAGQGIYVPFFGLETLTPTLIARLIQKTHASVFMACAVRQGGAYHAVIERVESLEGVPNTVEISRRMNQAIEALVRRYPAQYQWEYRRFRNAPDGTLRYP